MRNLETEFYFVELAAGPLLNKQSLTTNPVVTQAGSVGTALEGDIGVFEYGSVSLTLENITLVDFDGSQYSQSPIAVELRDADTSECLLYGWVDTDNGSYDHKTETYTCTAFTWDKWIKRIGAINPRDIAQTELAEPFSFTNGNVTPYEIKLLANAEINSVVVKGSILLIKGKGRNDTDIDYRFVVESASTATVDSRSIRTCSILPSGIEELVQQGPFTGFEDWITWLDVGPFVNLKSSFVIPVADNPPIPDLRENNRIVFIHPTVPANNIAYRITSATFHDHASASSAWWGIVLNRNEVASWIDDTTEFYIETVLEINSENESKVTAFGDAMWGVGATSTEPYDPSLLIEAIVTRSVRLDRMLNGIGIVERGETNFLPVDRRVNASVNLTDALGEIQRSAEVFMHLTPNTVFEGGVRKLVLNLHSRDGILNTDPESPLGISVPIEYSQEIGPNEVFMVVLKGHPHFNMEATGGEALGWFPKDQLYLETPPSGEGIIEIEAPQYIPSGEGRLYGALDNKFQNDDRLSGLAFRYYNIYNQYWRKGTATLPGTSVDYIGRFVSETYTTTTGFCVKQTRDYLNDTTVIELWVGDTYVAPTNAAPIAILLGGTNIFTDTEPFTAHFDASRSYDPNGDKLTYAWYKDDILQGSETGTTYLNVSVSDGTKIKVRVTDPGALWDEQEVIVSAISPGRNDDGFYVFSDTLFLDIDINSGTSTPTLEDFDFTLISADNLPVTLNYEVWEDGIMTSDVEEGADQPSPYTGTISITRPQGVFGSRTPHKYVKFIGSLADGDSVWVIVPVDRWPLPQWVQLPEVRHLKVGQLELDWTDAVDNDTTHVQYEISRVFEDDTVNVIVTSGWLATDTQTTALETGLGNDILEKSGRYRVKFTPRWDNGSDPTVDGKSVLIWIVPIQNIASWRLVGTQSQSGSVGTLDVLIEDDDGVLADNQLHWRKAETPEGTFTAWTDITLDPGGAGNSEDLGADYVARRLTVALQDGYNSIIEVRLQGDSLDDTGTTSRARIYPYVFDSDTVPTLFGFSLGWKELTAAHARTARMSGFGREDTDQIIWFHDVVLLGTDVQDHSGSNWAAPDGTFVGNTMLNQDIITVPLNQRLDVHFRGENTTTNQYGKIQVLSISNVALPQRATLINEKVQITDGGVEKARMRVYVIADPDGVVDDANVDGRFVTGGNIPDAASYSSITKVSNYYELIFPLHASHDSVGEIRVPMLASSLLPDHVFIATFDHDLDPDVVFTSLRLGDYNEELGGYLVYGSYKVDEDATHSTPVEWHISITDIGTDDTPPANPWANSSNDTEQKNVELTGGVGIAPGREIHWYVIGRAFDGHYGDYRHESRIAPAPPGIEYGRVL
jgi:hypothetical protein